MKYFLSISLLLILACGHQNEKQPADQNSTQKAMTLSTFSSFPSEIDGCSCYFSTSTKDFAAKKYIYVNDFANMSFLKINGVMTKFTQIEYKEVDKSTTTAKAKSEKYNLEIKIVNGGQKGDETWTKTGTIKVTEKGGQNITITFYGECGC